MVSPAAATSRTCPTGVGRRKKAASYSSAGGSITVARNGDTVSLTSNDAVPGYSAEVHDNGPTRVEVRFRNDDTEWRIRVDVVNEPWMASAGVEPGMGSSTD